MAHEEFVKSIAERIAEAQHVDKNDAHISFIVFVVGGEYYAIPIASVREVLRTPALTPVPTAPTYIQGIFSGKGKVIPAIDMAKRFHGERETSVLPSHLLVIEREHMLYGFLVDKVVDTIRLLPEDIHVLVGESTHNLSRAYIEGQFLLTLREKGEGFIYDFFIAAPKVKDVLTETPKETLTERPIFTLAINSMIGDLEREVIGL